MEALVTSSAVTNRVAVGSPTMFLVLCGRRAHLPQLLLDSELPRRRTCLPIPSCPETVRNGALSTAPLTSHGHTGSDATPLTGPSARLLHHCEGSSPREPVWSSGNQVSVAKERSPACFFLWLLWKSGFESKFSVTLLGIELMGTSSPKG